MNKVYLDHCNIGNPDKEIIVNRKNYATAIGTWNEAVSKSLTRRCSVKISNPDAEILEVAKKDPKVKEIVENPEEGYTSFIGSCSGIVRSSLEEFTVRI